MDLEEFGKRWDPFDHVRHTSPSTSVAAAKMVKVRVTEMMLKVFEIHLQHDGLTDEELLLEFWETYGPCPEASPRNRRADLVRGGYIAASDDKRLLNSGCLGIVWVRTGKLP